MPIERKDKMIKMIKQYSRCLFAFIIAALIIIASLCFLAHSERSSSKNSFSASQIYEMTEGDEEGTDSEISSRIGEELFDIFQN